MINLNGPINDSIFLFFSFAMTPGNTSAGNAMTTGSNSRRQSNVPRCIDSESICSLQGSLKRVAEYSPKSSQRNQMSRTPLYLSENSRTCLEQVGLLANDIFKMDDESVNQYQLQQLDKKPFAMPIVRPQRILYTNDEYRAFLSTLDLPYDMAARLRECKSLDVIPGNQLRHRVDSKRLPISKIGDRSTCSLDAGVSMICQDPMPRPFNLDNLHGDIEFSSNHISCASESNSITKSDKKAKNSHNCNGPLAEDAHCPLLYRQNSLSNPQDENVLQQKRWRSLETVQHTSRNDTDTSTPKKTVNRGSIRSWLVNLFQGNGFNDTSLRKTGVQNRVKGFSGFAELPPAPEHESIV